jgi:hypothetical protein
MDYSLISNIVPGGGTIYQGGAVDLGIYKIPAPLVLLCMDAGEVNEKWIDHKTIQGLMAYQIEDSPDACLPDEILIALADAAIAFVRRGVNLYVHCGAGISRSSYADIAIHMRLFKVPYGEAFAMIAKQRPQIAPNPGFIAQLKKLEPTLIS